MTALEERFTIKLLALIGAVFAIIVLVFIILFGSNSIDVVKHMANQMTTTGQLENHITDTFLDFCKKNDANIDGLSVKGVNLSHLGGGVYQGTLTLVSRTGEVDPLIVSCHYTRETGKMEFPEDILKQVNLLQLKQHVKSTFLKACLKEGIDTRGLSVENIVIAHVKDNEYYAFITILYPSSKTDEYKIKFTYDKEKNSLLYDMGIWNQTRLRTKTKDWL